MPGPKGPNARKGLGNQAKVCFWGHVLAENRNGLVVDVTLTQATETAEWEAAVEVLQWRPGRHQVRCRGDKSCNTAEFVEQCRFGMRGTALALDCRTT